MDKFIEGTVCYHKATGKRCVVVSTNDKDKLVKVRTEDDEERDYYPQELKTSLEVEAETYASIASLPDDSDIQF